MLRGYGTLRPQQLREALHLDWQEDELGGGDKGEKTAHGASGDELRARCCGHLYAQPHYMLRAAQP